MDQKKIRHDEERKLEEQWGFLIQERNNLEEQKMVLQKREKKYSEVKDLVPSARELKDMGVEFSQARAWIECIREKAMKEMIDEKTAAWRLAQELR